MNLPIPCRQCPLRDTHAFSPYSDEEIDFIQGILAHQVNVKAGTIFLHEGDDGKQLYTVLSGWAFRYGSLSDGRHQIFNFLLPGDFIGLQHQLEEASQHGIEALTDLTLCVFPRDGIWDLYRTHPALGLDITRLCAHEERIVDANLLSVGRRSATERIAMLLIHLYKRAERVGLAGPDNLDFPLTQQHIADALGLSLVHTNKTLKRLQKSGFFTLAEGRLKLVNPAAMARLADYPARPLRTHPLI